VKEHASEKRGRLVKVVLSHFNLFARCHSKPAEESATSQIDQDATRPLAHGGDLAGDNEHAYFTVSLSACSPVIAEFRTHASIL